MGNSFRNQPGPALYPDNKTPVAEDLLEVGLIFAAAMIAFSFVLIIPGIRGMERLWATIRVFTALFIVTVILVSNFGYCWFCGSICTRTQYKGYISPAGSRQEIEARVGVYIGLRGTNITLRETSCGIEADYETPFPDETIDYNERVNWGNPWMGQGRIGFGRFSFQFNREFRDIQFRGSPYPILWIAEYFTLDGEQIRWGRKFRVAGWYTHIFLWTAFATYLLAILLYIFNIRQGAWFTVITGSLMILAVFSYAIIIINDPPFELPFQDAILAPSFGWSWWLTLWTGIGTFFIGVFVLILDKFWPSKAAAIFHHSVVEDDAFFSEEDVTTGQPKLEEYGAAPPAIARGQPGRHSRGRTRRGLKPRNTIKRQPPAETEAGAEVIQLQEVTS